MAHEGIAFKGSKDYRDFKIEESTRHKLKNDCGYEVKNEYYLLLSKPEYIHLVLLLTLGKKSSTMPKKLKNKFSSLPDGERATINEYFNIN